jgi:LysR substrate binding domain
VPRSDYIVVGDTEADLEFLRRVGISSCWARYGYGNPVACRALAPDYEILARRMLRDVENMRSVGEDHADANNGTLTVATTHVYARYILMPVVQRFRQRFPNVRLSVRQAIRTKSFNL